mgnify:CR=1 FL=1
MKRWKLFTVGLVSFAIATAAGRAASAATEYLRHVYGADGVDLDKVAWPNDDLWMLRGAKNATGLAELQSTPIKHGANEVLWENVANGLCMIEVREGRVDPAFSLQQVYTLHRMLVLQFIYAALTQDRDALQRLTTNPQNVKFGRAKAPPQGDLDQYQEIIALIPVVRISSPASDKVAKSVSYRVPLGRKGLNVRVVKDGSTWRVDSNSGLDVPLEFFFR